MLVSEAKLREKFYRIQRNSSKNPVSKKQLKAMYYEEKKKNMGVVASSNIQRNTTRKVNRVLQLIRGKKVNQALAILKFTPKRAAKLIEKVVLSAKANAENGRNLDAENLFVARAYVEQGPTLPRVRPMSMGRVGRIRKRTCSTYIVLREKVQSVKKTETKTENKQANA